MNPPRSKLGDIIMALCNFNEASFGESMTTHKTGGLLCTLKGCFIDWPNIEGRRRTRQSLLMSLQGTKCRSNLRLLRAMPSQ